MALYDMNDQQWIRLNIVLRSVMVFILLAILGAVLFNKYGTPPNLEDNQLLDQLGMKVADCREALIYYAEHELISIQPSEADRLRIQYNLSRFNLTVVNYQDKGGPISPE